MRIINPSHIGIVIHLKNKRNSYSLGNGQSFQKNHLKKNKKISPT